jgi:mannosyltransferase OCH1-like enzyme
MRLIPKVIYQTWKTKHLDIKLQNVRNKIQQLNPTYEIKLFDDNDIEDWIKSEFKDETIYNTYKQLKVGAGRADFWRYLILYQNGGIYLDIDSNINKSLDLLISDNDNAIISRQKHNDVTSDLVQWCLIFAPKHPILLRTINMCIYNINNKVSTWLPTLTGPTVFTSAVNYVLKKHISLQYSKLNLKQLPDEILNYKFDNEICGKDRCRFYGKDYEIFCSYDNGCKREILSNSIYWKNDTEIFSSL